MREEQGGCCEECCKEERCEEEECNEVGGGGQPGVNGSALHCVEKLLALRDN